MPIARHTRQRQVVLLAVKTSTEGLTADQVWQRVRKSLPSIGRATIYRNLELLTKRGEIYRFDTEEGVRSYYGHASHAAVFRCQRCGKRWNIPQPAQIKLPRRFQRYQVFISQLSAQGLCPTCSNSVHKTQRV